MGRERTEGGPGRGTFGPSRWAAGPNTVCGMSAPEVRPAGASANGGPAAPDGPASPERRRLLLDGALVAVTLACLAAGTGLRLTGASRAGDAVWSAAALLALLVTLGAILTALRERRFGVDLLAALALGGSVAAGEYPAAVVIAVMVASGRLLESWAASRASSDLRRLLQHAPQVVHRYENGALSAPPLGAVEPGDLLLVKPGEIVPVDGRVVSTAAVLDMSSLTGESLPVEVSADDLVESGAVNAGDAFDLRAITTAEESTFEGVVRLVRDAMAERPPFVRMADRFAVGFIPFTLLLAGISWFLSGSATRAVAVLVVATPCPLILAAPIAMVAGLARTARSGVVVKGGAVLERLAGARVVVLDKTGTVTKGEPRVIDVLAAPSENPAEVLRLAASLEQTSPHVLASAVLRAALDRGLEVTWPEKVREVLGSGTSGSVAGHEVRVGGAEWLGAGRQSWTRQARRRSELDSLMTVYVEVDSRLAGAILLEDPIRPDAARAIRELRGAGVRRVVIASGDRQSVAETVGAALGVDEVLAERSPEDKVESIRLERRSGTTVMVGDGVNDAPALAAADVGVAMGARGASASSDAADVVLQVDSMDRLVQALRIARRSRRVAWESVLAGMAMSVAAMAVAAAGLLPALYGAILQEAIDVVVILNALRALVVPGTRVALSASEATVGRRIAEEHLVLRPQLSRIRATADALESLTPEETRQELESLERFLRDELLPHEEMEQEKFYPVVARLVGGDDPIGPMTRAHVEIRHLVSLFSRIAGEIGEEGPDEEERRDLRRVLYGLDAVLTLHFAQEDEGYLSIVPDSLVGTAGGKE